MNDTRLDEIYQSAVKRVSALGMMPDVLFDGDFYTKLPTAKGRSMWTLPDVERVAFVQTERNFHTETARFADGV